MGTNCAPLVADLFLFCYERDFMLSLSDNNSVGIPMGTNCAPLVADLFLFCYERDFMLSLSDNNQTDIIETFSSLVQSLLL